MKRIHLLRVDGAPETFAPLVEAAAERALRVGWLELADFEAPQRLATAARLGALRAVAVGRQQTVTVKQRKGPAVLEDLLREYFRGCVAVLVVGEIDAPELKPVDSAWVVTVGGSSRRRYRTAELLDALRQPRPFAT